MKCNVSTVWRLGPSIAPADTSAVVRTDTRERRDGRLHFVPGQPTIVEPRLQNHSGASIAHTIEMHLVTAYIYETARRRMSPYIIRTFNGLIDGSDDSKQDDEARKSGQKIADPGRPRKTAIYVNET